MQTLAPTATSSVMFHASGLREQFYYNDPLRNGLADCRLEACYWPFSIGLPGTDNLAGLADSGR